MKQLKHHLLRLVLYIRINGLYWSVVHMVPRLTYRLFFLPKLWERVFVRKVTGKNLVNLTSSLSNFSSEDLVSVVLPVNNGRSKGVERLVASLKTQSHKNIEFIAVDSGSTDDTVQWLKSQGFVVIEIEPESFTHSFSRNTGASVAKGKYLLFVVDDVVFNDPDWVRCALFLLNHYKADSLSSKQSIDDNADLYARCLDTFLMNSQSDTLSVNYSISSPIVRVLRRYAPLKTQLRSMAIDNTNHIVRKKTFDEILFETETVEDIDFARRLTLKGGRTIYTNLLSVLHYHQYSASTLLKYAKRVYIDTMVMSDWHRPILKISNRESFLLAGLYSLALFLLAIETVDHENAQQTGFGEKRYKSNYVSHHYLESVIQLTFQLGSAITLSRYKNVSAFNDAKQIFEEIFGAPAPPSLYFSKINYVFVIGKLREITSFVNQICFSDEHILHNRWEFKNVIIFLWVNFMFFHLAQKNLFKTSDIQYTFSNWGIKDW